MTCSFSGCDRRTQSLGLCNTHYSQKWRGRPLTPIRQRRPEGEGYQDPRGYVIVKRDGRKLAEHQWVMEQMLGRRLLPGENVHHRNGVKNDNRPENLELWVVKQPRGQRVEDLVEWAHEILARYETVVL